MEVSITAARRLFAHLIEAVQDGEFVVITPNGRPVAQIMPLAAAQQRRQVRFGSMRGRIKLHPGWDAPVDPDQFFEGRLNDRRV